MSARRTRKSDRVTHVNFSELDAAQYLIAPTPRDDKYSRGVVGLLTGSEEYPGAAVLGVSAALHTGIGMVRFVGSATPTALVLQHRPETVCRPGHADAWVLGSGVDTSVRHKDFTKRMLTALNSGVPCVLDAGALDLVARASRHTVITPHAHELARMFATVRVRLTADEIAADPVRWARDAARRWQVCVLLKGSQTVIANADGAQVIRPLAGSSWLATGGTGDVLAGVIGAVLASVSAAHDGQLSDEQLTGCVAAAATLHAKASQLIPVPFTALDLAATLGAARRAITGAR